VNGARILRDVEAVTRIKDSQRVPGQQIHPEILAMHELLPALSSEESDFVKKRIAFGIVHLTMPISGPPEFATMRNIRTEVHEHLPQVPQDLENLNKGWSKVFKDVLRLHGNPEA
jgi:hypothetical protein